MPRACSHGLPGKAASASARHHRRVLPENQVTDPSPRLGGQRGRPRTAHRKHHKHHTCACMRMDASCVGAVSACMGGYFCVRTCILCVRGCLRGRLCVSAWSLLCMHARACELAYACVCVLVYVCSRIWVILVIVALTAATNASERSGRPRVRTPRAVLLPALHVALVLADTWHFVACGLFSHDVRRGMLWSGMPAVHSVRGLPWFAVVRSACGMPWSGVPAECCGLPSSGMPAVHSARGAL